MKPGDLVRVKKNYLYMDHIMFVDSEGFKLDTIGHHDPKLLYLGEEVWSKGTRPWARVLHPNGRVCFVSAHLICNLRVM